MDYNKFTYDNLSDSAYSVSSVIKMFTFMINSTDTEIYNIFNSFLFPNTNRTN